MPVNGYKKTIHTYDHTISCLPLLQTNDFTANPIWQRATHIETEQIIPPANRGDIIIPAHDFPNEIHNEDFHYTHLVIGFLYTKEQDTNSFTRSRVRSSSIPRSVSWWTWTLRWIETKRLILLWQNNIRLVHQWQTDSEHNRPTAAELLRQSSYNTDTLIINESLTTPLPTFIHTGDSYFHEKELHLNTMLRYLGLPSFFIYHIVYGRNQMGTPQRTPKKHW